MPNVVIFRERLLAPGDAFLLEQACALRRYRPILAGFCRTQPALSHHLPEVLLCDGSGLRSRIAAHLYRKLSVSRSLLQNLREWNPSILHAHFALDGIQAMPIARSLHLPLIVSLRGFGVTSTSEAHRENSAGTRYLASRERLWHSATAFLCGSRAVRDAALRGGYPNEKLHIHYSGIDCDLFRPVATARDPKQVLFVGRLVEKKGCEYLLKAMALVQQSEPKAHLEVIGDGPLRPSLEALAADLGIAAHFRGVQDRREVQSSMSRSRVLCNPSVTAADGDREGFGMVLAEAQAVGTPVVSSLHAAIPEVVSHGVTGLLCPERSVDALADALKIFLRDEVFWSRTSELAAVWVRENFDLAIQNRKLESIYDDCLDRPQTLRSFPGRALRAKPEARMHGAVLQFPARTVSQTPEASGE